MGNDATGIDARHLRAESGVRRVRWILAASVFVLALVLRLAPLNRYVTPDEPAWVLRSLRFSEALAEGDLSSVPDTGHPGVTTMWLGSLGLRIQRWLEPQLAAEHIDWLLGLAGLSPRSPAAFRHLAFFLPAGRALVALVTSLGLAGIFLLADRLWGLSVALVASLLLALDAFLTGHSGLLHVDGLLAAGMALSALAMLLAIHSFESSHYSHGGQSTATIFEAVISAGAAPYRWAALSGVMAGLSALTKIPGGYLALFCVLLLLGAWLTRRVSWRQGLLALGVWGLAAGLTFLALHPALWADPAGALRGMFEVGERHVEGAIRPIFYRGQVIYDPDATFYPVVWLFRASPLVMIGVLIALFVYLPRPGRLRFDVAALLAFAVGFGLFVTFVGKKHDRYLLPAFLPLTLVAALGWEEVRQFVIRRFENRGSGTATRVASLWLVPAPLILIQALLILPFFSAPLGYYNPLLGGPRAALNWLEVGWGEGQGAAARWLNQQPAAAAMIVATPSIPPFASFFVGQTVPLDQQALNQADYIVLPPRQAIETLPLEGETYTTVYEKNVGGISHASVIRNPVLEEQVAYLRDRVRRGDLIVLDNETALAHVYDGPADLVVLADVHDPADIADHLRSFVPGHESLWYVALPHTSPITARQVHEQLACYGQPISTETVGGISVSQIALDDPGTCSITSLQDTPHDTPSLAKGAARFGDTLGLADALLPSEAIAWPDHLPVVVRWDALAPSPADFRTILHLTDDAGRIWVEGGREILDADYRRPSAWSAGDWTDQTFQLTLPPAIPPGNYSVKLGVFDPVSGRALSAWDAAGDFAGLSLDLGQVTVAPPPNPPSPWDMVVPERLDPPLAAGPLKLLGYTAPPERVASGDQVWFDLYWRAEAALDTEYALRWRLMTTGGVVVLEETVPLSPYPTNRWRVHELEQVRYDLAVAPDLPAGDHNLLINVLDASGAPMWNQDVTLGAVEIVARDRLFNIPRDVAYPLDVTLGDVVHLRGFDLDVLSALPGDEFPLMLYWQADGPTDLSYTVFVHLVGSDGMLYGQSDHPPAGGAAPSHTWAPGQVVLDEVSIPVLDDAPPGVYRIAVGLYDSNSGGRLPVYDATGAELANRQIVLPVEVTVE
jgi:hypothetical protein